MTRKRQPIKSHTIELILETCVEYPMLNSLEIAALLGRNHAFVRQIMQSDDFLEARAERIRTRYGDKLANARHRIYDTLNTALEELRQRMLDPERPLPDAQLLDAMKFLVEHAGLSDAKQPASGDSPHHNVTINLDPASLDRARQLQAKHAQSIDITPYQLPSSATPDEESGA